MNVLARTIVAKANHLRSTGLLHIVYALLVETLFICFLYFCGLFTLETLLPTFVTERVSLATFLLILVTFTMFTSLLGRFLNISFPWQITKKSPLLWLGLVWGTSLLLVSLIKFPVALIPVLIVLFLLSGYLFWSLFFADEEK